MALSSVSLKNRVLSKMAAAGFDTENEHSKAEDMAQAIAEAVVEELQASGAVSVTVVTTCPAGAGTGTGTGTLS